MELVWAVGLILLLAVTPSVMFLLFWQGLLYLRDDSLIGTLELVHGIELTERLDGRATVGVWNTPGESTTPVVACPRCGTETLSTRARCLHCESRIRNPGG